MLFCRHNIHYIFMNNALLSQHLVDPTYTLFLAIFLESKLEPTIFSAFLMHDHYHPHHQESKSCLFWRHANLAAGHEGTSKRLNRPNLKPPWPPLTPTTTLPPYQHYQFQLDIIIIFYILYSMTKYNTKLFHVWDILNRMSTLPRNMTSLRCTFSWRAWLRALVYAYRCLCQCQKTAY